MDSEQQTSGLFDVPEAARRLRISQWTLRKHIARGNLKPTRIGRRVLLADVEVARIAREGLPRLTSVLPGRSMIQ